MHKTIFATEELDPSSTIRIGNSIVPIIAYLKNEIERLNKKGIHAEIKFGLDGDTLAGTEKGNKRIARPTYLKHEICWLEYKIDY